MGEHHALRRALGAGGEEDRGRIVGTPLDQRALRRPEAAEAIEKRHAFADVLEIDQRDRIADALDQGFEPRLLDEGAGGDDGRDFRRPAGGEDVGPAGGEVDHRRDPARRHQAEDGDGGAVRIGQHDADRLALAGEWHQLPAEYRSAGEEALRGQGPGDRVLDRDTVEAVAARRRDDRLDDGAVGRGGAEDHVGHDLVERGAGDAAAVLALQLRRDAELDRLEECDRHLRSEVPPRLAAEMGEGAVLDAVDPHRDHRRVALVGDHRGAVIDFHQAAGHRAPAFREDDQRIAGLDRVDQRAGGERIGRVDRHRLGQPKERPHPRVGGHLVVDSEDRFVVDQRHQQGPVAVADMVADEDRVRAALPGVLAALHLQPVDGAEDQVCQVAKRAPRQEAEDERADGKVGAGKDQEDPRGRHAGGLEGVRR